MNGRNEENLKELFEKFFNAEQAHLDNTQSNLGKR